MQTTTLRVKKNNEAGYSRINLSDFNPEVHEPFDKEGAELIKAQKRGDKEHVESVLEAQRKANANYGQIQGGVAVDGRNTDGTFSTPTPTDIRYPNKDRTEFANNHGAFLRKSASEMRQDAGKPDVAGGIGNVVIIKGDWRKMTKDEQKEIAMELSGAKDLSIKQVKEIIAAEVRRRSAEGRSVEDGLTDAERAKMGDVKEQSDDDPLDSIRTHEAADQALDDTDRDPPEGWDKMKVEEKKEWLKSNPAD